MKNVVNQNLLFNRSQLQNRSGFRNATFVFRAGVRHGH